MFNPIFNVCSPPTFSVILPISEGFFGHVTRPYSVIFLVILFLCSQTADHQKIEKQYTSDLIL